MTTRVGKPRALILENRRNREHAIVQLHIPKLAGVNTKRDGKWTLEPTGSKTTGRIIIPVTRAPERSEPRSSLRLIEFFSGGAKYRFCGIIFNEPRAHTFFEDQVDAAVDVIPRENSVHSFLSRPACSTVYHYGFACAAPRSFSSHLEQVSPLLSMRRNRHLPRHFLRERVRARTRTRPAESFSLSLFLLLLLFLFLFSLFFLMAARGELT